MDLIEKVRCEGRRELIKELAKCLSVGNIPGRESDSDECPKAGVSLVCLRKQAGVMKVRARGAGRLEK